MRNVKKPKLSAANTNDYKYKLRTDYYSQAKHFNDKYKNLGYDYRGKMLKRSTSSELWGNPLLRPFYTRFEELMYYILEQVKYIKKVYSIAHEKNSAKLK